MKGYIIKMLGYSKKETRRKEQMTENEIKKLNLVESKQAVFEDIYNDQNFKGEDGKFNIKIFS